MTEVKLLLNEDAVMDEGFHLKKEFMKHFNLSKRAAEMKIWYLDTEDQTLEGEKWLVRYRYHEDFDLELTYKKRYAEDEFQRVAPTSRGQKFLKKAQPEVDMGLDDNTYSFSFTESLPMKHRYRELDLDEAKKWAIKRCPPILENWLKHNWGFQRLRDSVLYGPVHAMEYKGTYEGLDIVIEIWQLDGYFPELSFNVATDKAEKKQAKVKRVLEENGWLKPESILKTKLLFDSYRDHHQPS